MEIPDYTTLTPKHQADVLQVILYDENLGLSKIAGYGSQVHEIFFGDYGLSHQQWHAARKFARLAKALGNDVLEESRVQDLLFPPGDNVLVRNRRV